MWDDGTSDGGALRTGFYVYSDNSSCSQGSCSFTLVSAQLI
jgi:hypothetical protein